MSIGSISNAGLPLELLQAVDELGRDLRDESRNAARDEANRALAKGYEEADNLREQANDMLIGAVVSAAGAVGGAGLQVMGTAQLSKTLPTNELAAQQSIAKGEAFMNLGQTRVTAGESMAKFPDQWGKLDEADARRAAADAQAANRRAESEQSEAAEAQKSIDRARDTYAQMLELEHSTMMAAIGRRS